MRNVGKRKKKNHKESWGMVAEDIPSLKELSSLVLLRWWNLIKGKKATRLQPSEVEREWWVIKRDS